MLAAVTQTLTQYPFDFRGARILSGQDEGVFGWVTTNYLLENFIKVGPVASPMSRGCGHHPLADPNLYFPQYGWVGQWFRPRKGTLGAMDLGGASTQITFETASPAEDPANEVQLRLYGQRYRVYTHSFLCYGRDQVLRMLLASAVQVPSAESSWESGSGKVGAKGPEQSLKRGQSGASPGTQVVLGAARRTGGREYSVSKDPEAGGAW